MEHEILTSGKKDVARRPLTTRDTIIFTTCLHRNSVSYGRIPTIRLHLQHVCVGYLLENFRVVILQERGNDAVFVHFMNQHSYIIINDLGKQFIHLCNFFV